MLVEVLEQYSVNFVRELYDEERVLDWLGLDGYYATLQAGGPETRVSNIIMDLMMPLMSFWFALKLPAALGVYWIYQSVLGVAQQFALSKAMPLPTYTEEELRAIQKAEKAKQEAARAAMKSGVVSSKSLHHIDDDDEDEEYVPEIVSKFDREPSDTPAPNKKKKK